jgi:exodeoxyribonuclease VII small subunit
VEQPKSMKYQEAVTRLEDILERIDQSDVGIDELAGQVEEAAGLIRFCKQILRKTDDRIQTSLKSLEEEIQDIEGDSK